MKKYILILTIIIMIIILIVFFIYYTKNSIMDRDGMINAVSNYDNLKSIQYTYGGDMIG